MLMIPLCPVHLHTTSWITYHTFVSSVAKTGNTGNTYISAERMVEPSTTSGESRHSVNSRAEMPVVLCCKAAPA